MLDRRDLLLGAGALSVTSIAIGGKAGNAQGASVAPILESNGVQYRWAFSVSVFFKERVAIDAPFRRVFVPTIGGEVWGPRLTGIVVPYGGADYGGGGGPLDAQYMFQADDGHYIFINNRAYMKRIGADPSDSVRRQVGPVEADGSFKQDFIAPPDSEVPLRMRTSPFFDAPSDSPHAWMNSTLFFGHGLRRTDPDRTIFTYYEVL